MAEPETLGILVPTDKHLEQLIHVTGAAQKAGKQVLIFLTHTGVLLTQDPRYRELVDLKPGRISLCNVRWEELGLDGKPIPAGMDLEDMATQSRHVALIESCDRYLVL